MAASSSTSSASKAPAKTDAESGSLFKNFWSKNTLKKPIRWISYSSENAESAGAKPNSSDNLSRRRKQTYEAKQRHEARKADYVKSLEKEINKLRENTAAVRKEARRLATETRLLKDIAVAHGLDSTGASDEASSAYSWFDNDIIVEIGFDDVVQAERSFIKPSNISNFPPLQAPYPTGSSSVQPQQTQPQEDPLVYAVLDFILALEHVCRTHIHYPWSIDAPDSHDANCHLFTTTASLYSHSLPSPHLTNLHVPYSHTLPDPIIRTAAATAPAPIATDYRISYSEIQKLMQLSDALPVPEGDLTPVQAVRIIETRVPRERLAEVLARLKAVLGPAMKCFGYGASMEVEALDAALAALVEF